MTYSVPSSFAYQLRQTAGQNWVFTMVVKEDVDQIVIRINVWREWSFRKVLHTHWCASIWGMVLAQASTER